MFDYIHLRVMSMCFVRPKNLVQRIYENLKPGGWVEFQDYTFESHPANESLRERVAQSASRQAEQLIAKGLTSMPGYSREIVPLEQWKDWLVEIGFVDVEVKVVMCPISPWSTDPKLKQIGHGGSETALSAITAFQTMLASAGWGEDEIEALRQGIIKEHQDPTHINL